MWRRRVFGIVLAASLAANAWLLWVPASARTEAPQRPRSTAASHPRPAPPTAAPEPPPPITTLDRDALEKRLAAAEARLEELRPIQEKFERGERTPEIEPRVRALLDPLFAAPGDYTVECHGTLCKVDSPATNGWQDRMQEDPTIVGKLQGRAFGPTHVYMYVSDPGVGASINVLENVFLKLKTSPALVACKQTNPTHGTVTLALHFDSSTRKLTVVAGGSLADQAGGICIRRVLEDIVAATAIPPELTSIPEQAIPFEVP